jgi:hypothetical protein
MKMPHLDALDGEAAHAAIDEFVDKEPSNMKNLPTGLRVSFSHPEHGSTQTGTTIGGSLEVPLQKGKVLVCTDERDPKYYRDCNNLTGYGFGVILPANRVQPFEKPFSSSAYFGVPDHIGVFALREFAYDGALFAKQATGRLLNLQAQATDGRMLALVHWYGLRDSNFYGHAVPDPRTSKSVYYEQCYAVPTQKLRWCRMDKGQAFQQAWPGPLYDSPAPFKVGDYVVYISERPFKVTGERSYFAVAKGAILLVIGVKDDGRTLTVRTSGGVIKDALGLQTKVTSDMVAPLSFPYLEEGKRIEVVAQLEFRKKDLQGQRGVVVLPTDADGDVGIQFDEVIEHAGSLDGHGEDRRCLYVPIHAVKKVSK